MLGASFLIILEKIILSSVITAHKVARSYSYALVEALDLAGASVEQVKEMALFFGEMARSGLSRVWSSPHYSLEQKKQLAWELLSESLSEERSSLDLGITEVVQGFFMVALEAGRMGVLGGVSRDLAALVDERLGVKKGELVLAHQAQSTELDEIQNVVNQAFGGQVELSVATNPELLAGFTVRVGFLRFDGSLSGRLKALNWALHS